MILEAVVLILLGVYLLHSWLLRYWKRRNVFTITNGFDLLTIKDILLKKKLVDNIFNEFYKKYKQKRIAGFYVLYSPALMVTDPELIKTILVKDFNKFLDTALVIEHKTDPMFAENPFVQKGYDKWKELRGIQAALLTSSKIKEMIPNFLKVAQMMITFINNKKTEPIKVKELTFCYTVDNACSNAFGIEPNAFLNKDNDFLKYANSEKLFKSPLSFVLHNMMPTVSNLLRLRILSKDAENFFTAMSSKMIDHRMRSKTSRNDLISNLIRMNERFTMENKPTYNATQIAGQCLSFYVDSTETTSKQLSYLLLDLANNQHVQEKLRQEILSVVKDPASMDVDQIHSINYLIMVMNESLRLHTPFNALHRTCTENTTLEGVHISKGTRIYIPISSIHHDPEYFPEPNKYNPERFSNENTDAGVKYAFLPFGDGPRMCVGFKFAVVQMKIAVIYLLLNYKIVLSSSEDKLHMARDKNLPILAPTADTELVFQPL